MALTMSKTQSMVSRYMKKQEKFNSYSRTKIKTQKAIIGGSPPQMTQMLDLSDKDFIICSRM